jgi:hypothetical protein
MTTMLTLKSGHDVRYFTNHGGVGGCVGAMAYYTKAGEPPGQWYGTGATRLGLSGQVDPQAIDKLYMDNVSPDGEVLRKRPRGRDGAEAAAYAKWVKAHPFASEVEKAEFRDQQRAKASPKNVPYLDLTVNAVKSLSVVQASYMIDAMQHRARGDGARARALEDRAALIDEAIMDAARDTVDWLEAHGCYTRTGHHGDSSGEWRDGAGLTTALFPHHISRDGDPHLHVHIAIWNATLRLDAADDKYRTLFGRSLFKKGPAAKLGAAPVADRFLEARLREKLGFVMVPRADGNGCEIGGVSQEVMDQFSSRRVAITPEVDEMAAEYQRQHGKPPSQRTLWLMRQHVGQNTRRTKAQARRTANRTVHGHDLTAAERLAEWEKACTAGEMAAASTVHMFAEQFARDHAPAGADPGAEWPAPVPGRVLTDADKHRAARVAVAEVQKHHSAWGIAELRFEVHRALGAGVSKDDVAEVAALATSGRSGTGVVQLGAAPDIIDVTALGVRVKDGVSVYRPPGQELWATLDHLDLEEHIVKVAKTRVAQRVSVADAKAAVAQTSLTADQQDAVVAMLTGQTMTIPLNAAAGSGKSHTMAEFSRLWTQFTGRRVIGLTTSTNASYVLKNEGLAESYNIAQFLGKVKDSRKLRHPVRVHSDDVLILDEATQASTADVALIQQAARQAGARLYPVGDTHQMGAVEAGGIFPLLVDEIEGPRLDEVLRFRHRWEADASVKLRVGDITAHTAYAKRGRIHGGDHEAIRDQAAKAFLGDFLRGRDVLLLAASSGEASDLARRVQQHLIKAGRVQPGEVELADGNYAGAGDLIRARLNTHINAGGRRLTNRDTLRVKAVAGDQVTAQRKISADLGWSAPFDVPVQYVTANAELDYAGNAHVAEGRTVGVSHLLISQTTSRRSQYVMMTRGREENHAYVETGNTAPAGQKPYEQATVQSVMKGVMEREAEDLSATEQMRQAQEWVGGSGHVLHLWSVAMRERLYPAIDAAVKARLTPDQAARYDKDFAKDAFHARMREAQLAGHDISDLVDRVTADRLDGARSVASVLHSRLAGLGLDAAHDATWAQRTPDGAGQMARELAEGLDARTRELGHRAAERTQPWLARNLGVLDPNASPALREEYERRAGIAAGYREAAGITDPERDISPDPHEGNPELETWRKAAARALEIPDQAEALRGMSRGQLEAMVAEGHRAMAAAPPDVSAQLRAAALAREQAWAEHADAQVARDQAQADEAQQRAQAHQLAEGTLEPRAAAYEKWSENTAAQREAAGRAQAELGRRDAETPDWPDDWWNPDLDEQTQADVDAVLADEDLEGRIPDATWEAARQLQAERIRAAAAEQVERLKEAVREYQGETQIPDAVLEEAKRIRAQRIEQANADQAARAAAAAADPWAAPDPEPEPDQPSAYDAAGSHPDPEPSSNEEWAAAQDQRDEAARADWAEAAARHEAAAGPEPDEQVARQPGPESEAEFQARLHQLVHGPRPEPAADPDAAATEPDAEPDPEPAPEHDESWAQTRAKLDDAKAKLNEAARRAQAQRDEDQANVDYHAQQQAHAQYQPQAAPEAGPGGSWTDTVPDAEPDMEPEA